SRPRPAPPREAGGPIPDRVGGKSPIRHVIYVIKENRTYDQVFGDLPAGNGDPSLCLFGEHVTPNLHALARDFVLLDNFYANAEVSASGHEWSMGAYAAEFVEKTWPIEYGHKGTKVPYPAEGHFAAAVPALGDLWDRAAAAGISYRSYGEFVTAAKRPTDPAVCAVPALKGHFDPSYRPWDQSYRDVDRVARFVADLHGFEKTGEMPRLQILRLPQDHTAGAKAGSWAPTAMVADNDLAVGQLVEAVSHSKFWRDTAIFIVEDDAQNGPDHVDAHRTEALVISPWTRRHVVDSTPYTTCSMLRTMELILGLEPMSQFDAAATPMWASFQSRPDFSPWTDRPAQVDMDRRNPAGTRGARESAGFDFSHEDAVDDLALNRVVWEAVRGEHSVMPAPVHAAFVREITTASDGDADGDGDGD
ncbi:MAG TPA: alkaline phosphatase family protein, partial [Opitutaceae bacterium]|nr:alkaline phosphatase family protein [Opitutaceae bacterium]